MTTHQCPKCELRFTWPTELDDHCRNDHPEFHHEYPAVALPPAEPPPPPEVRHDDEAPKHFRPNLVGWLQPKRPNADRRGRG